MKYGLMVYDEYPDGQNIGDYVQSLAAKQFIPSSNDIVFVKRDWMNEYHGEDIKLIMNGWYSHRPENFKPSEKIHPLFISFHLNSMVKDAILTDENISYLKKHEPIGCRDRYTESVLKKKGINAYFSGCLTLTLGKTYKMPKEREEIYFIDPFIGTDISFLELVRCFFSILKNFKFLKKIQKDMFCRQGIKNMLKTALFFRQYSEFLGKDVLKKAKFLHNTVHSESNDGYFKEAEKRIEIYASAKLIVTSRIHAALPATGLDTPVLFVKYIHDVEASTCRFDGLLDLFNVVHHDGKRLLHDERININALDIKTDYKVLANNMEKTCRSFFEYDEKK
ncbi:MAG: polysaccharide pyruvyl transferase family protein [Treponema sp.]|nr:polysaccharide pyruvyl transferase family protein [Treponema sp.]